MSKLRTLILTVIINATGSFATYTQNYIVTGRVFDQTDQQPVIGAFITIHDMKDSTKSFSSTTDVNGKFVISELKKKSYKLTIQNINYARVSKVIDVLERITDLGIMTLEMESKVLNEVIVRGQGTAIQKGDTTIMTADAFKVNPDANAEDLVKKMPGITVESGTLKAQGQDVQKVLVDGKPFFGDDPSVALRNLPAEVIDKVQVYNKLSDQAELTGFDDGESSKTINIITRKNSRIGQFGKITGGTDFTDKYLVGGNLNIFKGPRRFTITGMTNNINQQNFSMQDLLGSVSGGGYHSFGRMGGGNFGIFGGQGGITKNSSFGLNYTDNWGKKIMVNASYFYNSTINNRVQESNTEYLFITDGKYSSNISNSITKNYNHRFNLRMEYVIDSLNTLILVPRISIQKNSANNQSVYLTTGGLVNSQTSNVSLTDATAYSLGNELTWRHKFHKPGRTLSLRSSLFTNDRNSDNTQIANTDSVPDNQFSDGLTNSFSMNTNLSYTEPVGKNTMVQFNFSNTFSRNKIDKKTFGMGAGNEILGQLDSLSNVYDNDYITDRGGLAYLYKIDNLNFSAGFDYQYADLKGDQTFPQKADVNIAFKNFLPNLMINYKLSGTSNLRISYRTYTRAPSASQLQNIIDNSNRLSLSTGNPKLRQEYSHNFMTNLSFSNPTRGINSFIYLTAGYTHDIIGSRTIYAKRDTLYLTQYNVTLKPGGQLSFPINLDHSMIVRTYITFGYFLKPIKSNINMVLGGDYSMSPGYIDTLLNRSNSYNLTNSLIISSNISSNLDFTLSYTSNYSIVRNSANAQNIIDTKYWYQSASFKFNWIFGKGFVLQTDVVGQYNKGLSQSYNQSYVVWNASFGKKFLKKQAAEVKLGLYDILNQNNNISRSVTASTIRDTRTNAFQRYVLVMFTYNLKNFNGQQPPGQRQQDERHDGFPGGGMPPGMRPGGGIHPGGP